MALTPCVLAFALLRGGRPAWLPRPFGADLEAVTPTALPGPDAPNPARLRETTRSDLTGYGASDDDAPGPARGSPLRTPPGMAWWGTGPTDGAPRSAMPLPGSNRTGLSMVDMRH